MKNEQTKNFAARAGVIATTARNCAGMSEDDNSSMLANQVMNLADLVAEMSCDFLSLIFRQATISARDHMLPASVPAEQSLAEARESYQECLEALSGDRSTAATSGYRSTAATSGYRSTAATSGYRSTAATSGYSSTAATSGDRSTAKATAKQSIAAAVGDDRYGPFEVSVEVGPDGIAAAWAEIVNWTVHPGAILVQRWVDGFAMLDSAKLEIADGATVRVVKGVVQP
jgi:hypothetical protein